MIFLRNNERVIFIDKGFCFVILKMINEVLFGVFRKLSLFSENFEVNLIEFKLLYVKEIVW